MIRTTMVRPHSPDNNCYIIVKFGKNDRCSRAKGHGLESFEVLADDLQIIKGCLPQVLNAVEMIKQVLGERSKKQFLVAGLTLQYYLLIRMLI